MFFKYLFFKNKRIGQDFRHYFCSTSCREALDATQKALVRMLAQNPALKPFSKAVVLKLRTIIGIESLEATHIQRAMSKLTNVVFKSLRDTYEFENAAFAQWVRTLAD